MNAFYARDGGAFVPSELTRGPWDPGAQHAGPPSALLGRPRRGRGTLIGRITIELLRPVPIAPLRVAPEVVRPGRNVELVEAVMTEAGGDPRPIARAIAWRLRTDDRVRRAGRRPAAAGTHAGHERPFFPTGQDVGYHTAMDYRFIEGAFTEPGPARVWLRMRQPLVAGEPTSPLARVLVAADSGNGVSAALDYGATCSSTPSSRSTSCASRRGNGSTSTRSPTSARTASGCRRVSSTTRPAGSAAPPRRCWCGGADRDRVGDRKLAPNGAVIS